MRNYMSSKSKDIIKLSKSGFSRLLQGKDTMTEKQKRRLLIGLRKFREEYTGNVGGEMDMDSADGPAISEDALDKPERNVIAKTLDTKSDFDSYVNQRRGIEMTPKEQQSIINFKRSQPTQRDKFFVKYESTDNFGNNSTTVIKKIKEDGHLVWKAFQTFEGTEEEEEAPESNEAPKGGAPEEAPAEPEIPQLKEVVPAPAPQAKPQQPAKPAQPQSAEKPEEEEATSDDPIRITTTVPFADDIEGANVLADLLIKLTL